MVSGRPGNDYADFSVMADNEYPDYSDADAVANRAINV